MPLSWNEIKTRSIAFSKEWADEASEDAEAKSFSDAFFDVFGVNRRRIASFEVPIQRGDGSGGFIDLLWKGILLVEHKSRGKNLDRAAAQARDYFPGLKDRDLPRYVLVKKPRAGADAVCVEQPVDGTKAVAGTDRTGASETRTMARKRGKRRQKITQAVQLVQIAADLIHQPPRRISCNDCGYAHILVAVMHYALTCVVLHAILRVRAASGCRPMS